MGPLGERQKADVITLSMAETAVTSAADILMVRHAAGRDVASRFGILAVGTETGTAPGAPLDVLARRLAESGSHRKARGVGQAGRADGLWGVLKRSNKGHQPLFLSHQRVA